MPPSLAFAQRSPGAFDSVAGLPFLRNMFIGDVIMWRSFVVGRITKNATNAIVVFGDFLCHQCAVLERNVDEVARRRGDVRVTFVNFPLERACNPMEMAAEHAGACALAEGGECMHLQGLFWSYHDFLYADPRNVDAELIGTYMRGRGLDAERYNQDVISSIGRKHVQADVQFGRSIGVSATPSLIINGRLMSGAMSVRLIELALEETARLDRERNREHGQSGGTSG